MISLDTHEKALSYSLKVSEELNVVYKKLIKLHKEYDTLQDDLIKSLKTNIELQEFIKEHPDINLRWLEWKELDKLINKGDENGD